MTNRLFREFFLFKKSCWIPVISPGLIQLPHFFWCPYVRGEGEGGRGRGEGKGEGEKGAISGIKEKRFIMSRGLITVIFFCLFSDGPISRGGAYNLDFTVRFVSLIFFLVSLSPILFFFQGDQGAAGIPGKKGSQGPKVTQVHWYIIAASDVERFSIECRKTKTKVITAANQNKGKLHIASSSRLSFWNKCRHFIFLLWNYIT